MRSKNLIYWTICIVLLYLSTGVNSECGCNKLKRQHEPNDLHAEKEKISESQETCSGPKSALKDLMHEDSNSPDQVDDMALIQKGTYFVGTNEPIFVNDRESPERMVSIDEFYLDKHEVTNAKFKEFVEATNYVTEAEKFGDSFVFKGQIDENMQEKYKDYRVANALWW